MTVDLLTVALMLLAAVLHAAWHSLVKSSDDPIVSLAGMGLVGFDPGARASAVRRHAGAGHVVGADRVHRTARDVQALPLQCLRARRSRRSVSAGAGRRAAVRAGDRLCRARPGADSAAVACDRRYLGRPHAHRGGAAAAEPQSAAAHGCGVRGARGRELLGARRLWRAGRRKLDRLHRLADRARQHDVSAGEPAPARLPRCGPRCGSCEAASSCRACSGCCRSACSCGR